MVIEVNEGKQDIKSMTPREIKTAVESIGQPGYRAGQIFAWLWRGVSAFDEMTDLPRRLAEQLKELYFITKPAIIGKQESAADRTVKYLWRLSDGNCVESVLMRYKHGNSVCISTQVGCRMGCVFCASSGLGFERNLTPAEMADQVLFTALDSGTEVNSVVLMGIGEPMDNFSSVLKFLKIINAPEGVGLGMRHISLSTCGIPGGIERLAEENLQLTLSVSLHAPDDETRGKIMPVNNSLPIGEIISRADAYFEKTGRRVSYEYAMIKGINDSPDKARLLSKLLAGKNVHLNLIRLNRIPGSPLEPSSRETTDEFVSVLTAAGINVTVRRKMGEDIAAACGQLRRGSIGS